MELLRENKRFERIGKILKILKSHSCSAAELAERFGVSQKTITRDMEILKSSGIKKEKSLYKYDENAIDNNLNTDETAVLAILSAICKNMGANFFHISNVLFERISGRADYSVFANLKNENLDEAGLKNFAQISLAIKNKNIIKCDYKKHKFEIKPLKIAFFEGFWYLLLLDCHAGDKFKRFYFKDIKNIEVINEKFKIPDKFEKRLESANSVWFELENSHTARLLIMPIVAKYFERKKYIKGDIMCRNNDGSIEIECEFSNIMEIKPLIYYFLPHIKVIEPAWLNDEIKAEIAGYLGEIS